MKLNIVPPRTGLSWVRSGIRTFLRQPLALSGLFFMYMAAVLVISQLPLVGALFAGMLVPAATLGLMAASAEASKGRFPMPSILLSAFRAGRQRLRAMLVLGAIYAAGSVLASGLAAVLTGQAPSLVAGGGPEGAGLDASLALALALHLPLFLAFWHAPALVHWHGIPPAKSLFFSAVAVMRNFGAMALYALAWMAVFLGVAAVVGLLGAVVGGPALAQAMMLPVSLVLAAMFSCSVYFSFHDSFVPETEPRPAPGVTPV